MDCMKPIRQHAPPNSSSHNTTYARHPMSKKAAKGFLSCIVWVSLLAMQMQLHFHLAWLVLVMQNCTCLHEVCCLITVTDMVSQAAPACHNAAADGACHLTVPQLCHATLLMLPLLMLLLCCCRVPL